MGQHQWNSPANVLLSLVFLLWFQRVSAANWAQVSGTKHTNAAVREITPWTSRHGHAVAALDFSDDYVRSTGQKARLFVLGGDSNVQGSQDLRAYPGGGAMRNDVWSTTGPTWNLQTNILKTTKWGDPLPQIVANVTWLQTNNGKRPPRGVSYSDWIVCASAAWAVHSPSGCDDPTKPPGAYLADNMFSPRRNFVALAFQNELFVFGGRAREHFPVPQSQLRGGTGPESLAPHNSALVHKASRPELQCEDDDQCEGDASCQVDEATSTGFCVCNMWSPREFHAVAAFNDALFLSGGYALIELGNCGVEENARKRPSGEEFACGGGYRAYLNDIWTSTDGQHWKMLKLHADFSPRGEHSMVVFNSLLYILSGRTGASQTQGGAAETELLNDVWVSANGSTWTRVAKPAPWPPRAKHVTLVLPGAPDQTSGDDPDEQLILMFGEDAERALEDVWVWKGGDTNWIKDYSSDTAFSEYVRPTSDVSYLRTMVDADALALGVVGITRIQDLTTLSFDKTIALRELMPICDYISLAKLVVEQCTVQPAEYEGQENANVKVIQGANGDAEAAQTTTISQNETNWDGCIHIGTKVTDATTGRLRWADVLGVDQVQVLRDVFVDVQESICQWRPKPRSGHAGVVFKRNVLVLGGLTAPDYYDNDVWYRGTRRPLAQFTLTPPSGSSDSVFKFESDKPYCLFEYSLLDTAEQLVVRNWTVTLGEVDYESWLDSGTFRMRIRARDPAGNVDATVAMSTHGFTVGFVLLAGFLMEWRKRRKRAAMERYAMKRMRRKLKKKNAAVAIVKEGDSNWRETYDDAKEGKKGKKGKKSSAKRKPTTSKDKKTKSKSTDKTKEKKSKTKTKTGADEKKKTRTKDGAKKAKTTDTKAKTKTKDASAKKKKAKNGAKTAEKRASKSGKKDKSDKKKTSDKSKGDKKPKSDKKKTK